MPILAAARAPRPNCWRCCPPCAHCGMHGPMWAAGCALGASRWRSEEHTSELQSHSDLVCRLLLEKKKKKKKKKRRDIFTKIKVVKKNRQSTTTGQRGREIQS